MLHIHCLQNTDTTNIHYKLFFDILLLCDTLLPTLTCKKHKHCPWQRQYSVVFPQSKHHRLCTQNLHKFGLGVVFLSFHSDDMGASSQGPPPRPVLPWSHHVLRSLDVDLGSTQRGIFQICYMTCSKKWSIISTSIFAKTFNVRFETIWGLCFQRMDTWKPWFLRMFCSWINKEQPQDWQTCVIQLAALHKELFLRFKPIFLKEISHK